MLYENYGSIIIEGLCNSPKFLVNHFKREIKKIRDKGFELEEIEHDFKETLAIIRGHIQKIYDEKLNSYNQNKKEDNLVQKNQRHNYPKPDINQISISKIKYPSGNTETLSNLSRKFTLKDFESVETALITLFENQPDHCYASFDDLFKYVVQENIIPRPENALVYETTKGIYKWEFENWLKVEKGCEENQYQHFLTKKFFKEFLFFKGEQELKRKVERENERLSWEPQPRALSTEELAELINSWNRASDTKPLKQYIENNYLNIHPDNFTLERLKQLKRNISTWKLKLMNLQIDPALQNFIGETIKDIDLKIERYANNPPRQQERETEQEIVEVKPIFKPEVINIVIDILKGFFNQEQQTELKQIIETGNKANKKLLFKGSGNRLTDTFKKLIEHDFITGCQKRDLINWIISNFNFMHQNKVKAFVYDTVEKTVSRNDYPCKSPLIVISKGQVQKVEQPRKRKQSKY